MEGIHRFASLAVVIADLNGRLSQAEHNMDQEKQRAEAAEARIVELERDIDTLEQENR